jgi:hypothetical protein
VQTVRSQIELYKLQHGDQLPDFRHLGWKQLTSKTDAHGNVTDAGPIGPYLMAPPANPLLGDNTHLLIVREKPRRDFVYDKRDCGFVIDEQGHIWALDSNGKLFDENATRTPGAAAAAE